jgi:hypothetical protein
MMSFLYHIPYTFNNLSLFRLDPEQIQGLIMFTQEINDTQTKYLIQQIILGHALYSTTNTTA